MINSPGPRQLAYAPTPHSYMPNSALQATISLDEVYAPNHLRGAIAVATVLKASYRK